MSVSMLKKEVVAELDKLPPEHPIWKIIVRAYRLCGQGVPPEKAFKATPEEEAEAKRWRAIMKEGGTQQ